MKASFYSKLFIVNSQDWCLGKDECGSKCLKVCPWDLPQFGSLENVKMEKCNLYLDRIEQEKQTICVEACPVYALDAAPFEELAKRYESS